MDTFLCSKDLLARVSSLELLDYLQGPSPAMQDILDCASEKDMVTYRSVSVHSLALCTSHLPSHTGFSGMIFSVGLQMLTGKEVLPGRCIRTVLN